MQYNPFATAIHAAWSELSSDEAKAFYATRAQQDLGLMVWAIATAATTIYQLGVQTRQFVSPKPILMDAYSAKSDL